MFAREGDVFMTRATQALTRPLQSRCAELTVLFDRASISELQTFFPILIDHIFGPQSTFNWGLRTTNADVNAQDFQALQHFLSPFGPLFKVIYTLLRDPLIKYDFSIGYLPLRVRQILEGSSFHPFYADLVHTNSQTRSVTSLLLNPFDYYFFHFSYHLINPWHQRSSVPFVASWNTVYYSLCCDYVLHFLPTDPMCPVLPVINFYCGKNPIQQLPSINKPVRTSKLLRSQLFSESANDYIMHQTLDRHPRNEIWRSETVLVVFTDMWLNNDQVNIGEQGFGGSPTRGLYFNELPTGEYVRIIRVLVKQLHAFAHSAKADDTHMGELKKVALPMVQGKMYIFLRNLVHRWPLDGSFRLVLELWLSFIQPWRYATPQIKTNQPEVNADLEDLGTAPTKSVEREYIQFIAENLLAYTVIFRQLLPRFTRVDLASPKMSLMLYRLTKVFDQPNLVPYLREIESSIDMYDHSPPRHYNSNWNSSSSAWTTNASQLQSHNNSAVNSSSRTSLGGLHDSPAKSSSNKWSTIIKQKMQELESSSFQYIPLFNASPTPEVYELVNQITRAREVAQSVVQARIEEQAKLESGFLGYIKSMLLMTDSSSDEFTLEERRKVPVYLDFALQNILDMFQITEIHIDRSTNTEMNFSSSAFSITQDLRFLTPEKVKERIKHIKYEGDPDLLPVGTHENNFLVALFHRIASFLNKEFQQDITKYYYKTNYIGRLTRQLLRPPMTIYKYDKSQEGRSPRVAINLPPRISFRPLASHKFLVYMILGGLLSNLFGYSAYAFIFFVLIIWFFTICLKALFGSSQLNARRSAVNMPPNVLDFNDSM